MSTTGDDNVTGTERQDAVPVVQAEDNTTTVNPQPAAANGVAPDNNLQQQQMQQFQNQHQPPNHQQYYNHQNGYNMGYYQQHFQPTPQQPLQIPQYGPYYGNHQNQPQHQNYQGYFYPPVQNMPQHVPQPQHQQHLPAQAAPPPPPPPARQQPAATGHNRRDSEADNDGDQSDVMTEQGNQNERRYSGPLADNLHAWAAERRQGPNEGTEIYETLAQFMSHQLERPFSTQELDQSVKDYPTLVNVPLAVAPELEEEIAEYARLHRDNSLKATEAALKSIQKGLASALNALGPLAEVIMKQGAANEELGTASTPVMDIIKYISVAMAGISKKRRDFLRPHIDAKYQKLGKNDEDFDATFLFGGNLSERARKVKAQTSIMKEVMKSDTKTQGGQGKNQNSGQNRSANNNSAGYRGNNRPAPYPNQQQGRSSGNSSSQSGNQSAKTGFRRGGQNNNQNNNNNGNKTRRP